MYTLTLGDGTEIAGLTKTVPDFGEPYYTTTETLDKSTFNGNLYEITETDDDTGEETVYTLQKLACCFADDNGTCIAFIDQSPAEKAMDTLQAQLDYIAMMADIDMEE